MPVALALSAVLAASAPDPLTSDQVAAALGKGWWCTWDAQENGCSAIQRYDFAQGRIYGCTGTDVAWLDVALGWARDGLEEARAARPLMQGLRSQAQAHGARLIKFCWTSAFKLDDRGLCQPSWSLVDQPTMRLSRSGAWTDAEDLVVPAADARTYWDFWPAAFDGMVANIPAEALADPEVKAFVAVQTAEVGCQAFEAGQNGRLSRTTRLAGDVATDELRPLAHPEDGVLVQRLQGG